MNSKRLFTILMTAMIISLAFSLLAFSSGAESEDIYTYKVKDGVVTITGCDSTASGKVTVPCTLGGYPVSYIMDGAFDGCYSITEIIVPSSVKELGTVNTASVTTAPATTAPVTTAPVTTSTVTTTVNDGWTKPIKSIPPPAYTVTASNEEASGIFKDCSALVSLTLLAPDCIINESTVKLAKSVNIYGYTVSTAKNFADKNANPFFDLNEDASHEYYAGAIGENYEIVYFINKETKNLAINGLGRIPDYSGSNDVPWTNYSQSIGSVTFSEGITGIGGYAFSSLNIMSLIIPECITEISDNAFSSCTALETVTVASATPAAISETAFSSCSSLTKIIVPLKCESIYKAADGWSAYADIIFPEFVYGDSTGDYAVNSQDVLLLRKYMADYDYTANTSSVEIGKGSDANGDGAVKASDVLLLRKYMANLDYETGYSTVVLGPAE